MIAWLGQTVMAAKQHTYAGGVRVYYVTDWGGRVRIHFAG